MSAAPQTTARALEATFQPILAAGLGPAVSVRLQNAPVSKVEARKVPAVIISAERQDSWLAMKVAGRTGEVCDLTFKCRHSDDVGVEQLAGRVREIIQAATVTSGWLFLMLDEIGEAPEMDGATRVVSVGYTARCLTAP